ncbi:MAG: DUF4158 domain-containing protein [Burkholderiales bacterium]|nr:DUF4158 domain-containing protein [Burkholderiales bacterium]
MQLAEQVARRDITPGFIVAEIIAYLRQYRVECPDYMRLQRVVSQALTAERERLAALLFTPLDDPTKAALVALLVKDGTLLNWLRSKLCIATHCRASLALLDRLRG